MFSISELKANLTVVRPNIFYVNMTLPGGIFTQADSTTISKLKFRCESVELPGRTLATYDDQSTGTTKKMAYDVTYNDVLLNLIVSEDMNERYIFEKWIDKIVSPSAHNSSTNSGGIVNYYKEYAAGTVNIVQAAESGSTLCTYTLHNAYPIQISGMNLNWAEFDTYQRFSVTMTYRYYTRVFWNRLQ